MPELSETDVQDLPRIGLLCVQMLSRVLEGTLRLPAALPSLWLSALPWERPRRNLCSRQREEPLRQARQRRRSAEDDRRSGISLTGSLGAHGAVPSGPVEDPRTKPIAEPCARYTREEPLSIPESACAPSGSLRTRGPTGEGPVDSDRDAAQQDRASGSCHQSLTVPVYWGRAGS